MACNTNLFPLLGSGVFIGGTWSLTAFSNSPATITVSHSETDGSYINSSIDTSTQLPFELATEASTLFINPDNMSPGTYTFTYTATTGGCTDSSTIEFTVVDGANSGFGDTNNITVCSNDTSELYLIDLLNGNYGTTQLTDTSLTLTDSVNYTNEVAVIVNGNISNPVGTISNYTVDTAGLGSLDENSVLDIAAMITETGASNDGDTVEINYISTRIAGSPEAGCTNCVETTTILITVEAPPNAGTDNTVTICNLVS
jgi:hypothetical protein